MRPSGGISGTLCPVTAAWRGQWVLSERSLENRLDGLPACTCPASLPSPSLPWVWGSELHSEGAGPWGLPVQEASPLARVLGEACPLPHLPHSPGLCFP